MLKFLYNKGMGVFALFEIAIKLLKYIKTPYGVLIAALAVVVSIGAYAAYDDIAKKHQSAIEKIESNTGEINALQLQNAVILSTLEQISKTVNKTDDRIWQMVQELKSKK